MKPGVVQAHWSIEIRIAAPGEGNELRAPLEEVLGQAEVAYLAAGLVP